MIQALVLNNSTVIRATVIANRTGNNEIGIAKAMMVDNLKTKLENGIAHFVFLKKNGKVREAWGTLKTELVAAKTNGRGKSRESYQTAAYFDIEKGDWRSFRWETLVKVF